MNFNRKHTKTQQITKMKKITKREKTEHLSTLHMCIVSASKNAAATHAEVVVAAAAKHILLLYRTK